MISLADRLLKVIAGHEWGWQDEPPDSGSRIIGLVCGCGWGTSATDQAVDRWKRHRDRAVREAIAEHEATPDGSQA